MPKQRKQPRVGPERTPPQEPKPEAEGRPITTGDMQEVGATRPEEVPARRRTTRGKAPTHENPGDQNSG